MVEIKVLKVISYGETEDKNSRVTINPMKVDLVFAALEPVQLQNRSVIPTAILLENGTQINLHLGDLDLHELERVVGAYDLPETGF